MSSMILSGQGTKDSPILLDDDSESEVITELIGTPSPYPILPEDSERTPRLSPRPGTLLSNVARLNLSRSSAQTLKKYRQDLRQHTHDRKRKRAPSPSPPDGAPCNARGQLNSASIVVEVATDGVKCESDAQQQHVNSAGKLPHSKIGPPAKKPRHKHKPSNERTALPDPPTTLKDTTIFKAPSVLGSTSRLNATPPVPKHSRFPDSAALPPSVASTSYPFDLTSLPLPVPAQDLFNGHLMSPTPEPFAIMDVGFDPVFWAMSMSMNGFAMSATPFPPVGMPLPPKPTTAQKQQSKLPLPPSKTSVKSELKPQLSSSKSSTKLDRATSVHLPARPPHSNDKPSVSRQRPFTLCPDRSTLVSTYFPIGKPDFRDIHGVFPIIPPLMFPALPGMTPPPYTPDLDRTLVLENLPKPCSSSKVWIQNWCLKACGSLPELILVGPRRAFVVFKQPEHAIDAWASPKLGVDETEVRIVGVVGGSKLRLDVITAYWYRPDAEKERQLVTSWTASKRMVTEIQETLPIPMDETAVTKVLTEWSGAIVEVQQQVQTTAEPRVVLQKMASEMGFHEKLAAMTEIVFTEEVILRWEQKEIALIERERRMKTLPRCRPRQSEVELVGSEERKTEVDKSALRSTNTQPIPLYSLRNQRNALNTSTGAAVPMDIVVGPGSMSELPSPLSSTLPQKPQSLNQPLPSSSTEASRTIPPGKPELRFGQTAWKTPDFTTSSSSKPQQTRIHPNPSVSVKQSEQHTSNISAPPTASTSTEHAPILHPSSLPSSLPAKPKLSDTPSCNAPAPPLSSGKPELLFGQTAWNLPTIHPTVSSSATVKPSSHSPPMFPARPILGDRKELAESQEPSQTVSGAVPAHTPTPMEGDENPDVLVTNTSKPQTNQTSLASDPRISAAKVLPKPVDSSGSVKPQPLMISSSVPAAKSESVPIPNPGKAVASTFIGTLACSSLTLTPVMAVTSGFEKGTSDRVQISDTVTDQSAAVKTDSGATLTPQLTLVSAPRSPPGIPLRMLQELKRVLAKSTEERQNFLENEFKATRLLMDRLMTITCKKERKQATDLWKQKIRIIDEVTRSIRNDAKVWYSQETKTWIRMRWPDCLGTSGILVIDVDD